MNPRPPSSFDLARQPFPPTNSPQHQTPQTPPVSSPPAQAPEPRHIRLILPAPRPVPKPEQEPEPESAPSPLPTLTAEPRQVRSQLLTPQPNPEPEAGTEAASGPAPSPAPVQAPPTRNQALVDPPSSDGNAKFILIHDGQVAKWSWKQSKLLLARAYYCGQLTSFSFWLVFLAFSTLIDLVKLDKFPLLRQDVYLIKQAIDMGIISNLDAGEYGWVIATIVLLILVFIFKEALWDRSRWSVTCALLALNAIYISLMFITAFTIQSRYNKFVPSAEHVNILTIFCVFGIWCGWLLFASYIFCWQVRLLEDDLSLQSIVLRPKRHDKGPK